MTDTTTGDAAEMLLDESCSCWQDPRCCAYCILAAVDGGDYERRHAAYRAAARFAGADGNDDDTYSEADAWALATTTDHN